ncbi:mesaconyl-C4 CoA hydratase [Pedococcus sp. NPDC057267]|uniref:mesaconyl-C4 CoA hydratase n=1 Tax=Pedococcus sp. NPDC057267 TaxID=3346077 RepID=UPI003632D094
MSLGAAPGPVARRTELVTPEPAEALAGLLDIDPPASTDGLPPLWHWVYLLERRRESELGPDGHPTRGIPAPPGPGRLRMFAGGRVTAYGLLRFGAEATRSTRVLRSVEKQGRSGPLTFVTVRSEVEQEGRLVVAEEQDIVYREAGSTLTGTRGATPDPRAAADAADAPAPSTPASDAPASEGHRLQLAVDPVLLFRFSALTYNAHRIHYDQAYAAAEGYPGLVVHGPLQALLMGEAVRRSGVPVLGREFAYRLVAPTYGAQPLTVTTGDGAPGVVEASVHDGSGVRTATSTLSRGTR